MTQLWSGIKPTTSPVRAGGYDYTLFNKIKSRDIPESRLVQLLVNLGQMRHLNNLVETDKTF